jgi:hypothetical protein
VCACVWQCLHTGIWKGRWGTCDSGSGPPCSHPGSGGRGGTLLCGSAARTELLQIASPRTCARCSCHSARDAPWVWGSMPGRGSREGNVPFQAGPIFWLHCPSCPLPALVPSALQVLCVFMKFRAQLQRWPPLVLLQSCEQVPKRRHSLMSGVTWESHGMSSSWGFVSPTPSHPAFLPWHPGCPGTVWNPERQAQ